MTPAGLGLSLRRPGDAVVSGEVTLYGVVCVHQRGYRAERARVDRLYLRPCGAHALRPSRPAGSHGPDVRDTLALLLGLDQPLPPWIPPREFIRAYCACRDVEERDWLPPARLHALADALGRRYGCETVVHPVRLPRGKSCGRAGTDRTLQT
jgi:hypothetical protein